MEDALDAVEEMPGLGGTCATEFYAVYDGHSGTQAVEYVKRTLPSTILGLEGFLAPDNDRVHKALEEAFLLVDNELIATLLRQKTFSGERAFWR